MWRIARGQARNWLNAAVNRQNYLARLAQKIEHLHRCCAKHRSTVPVHEVFRGQTVWQGAVEVFDLTGHPEAKRCYGWFHKEGANGDGGRYVAVLELPPVDSAQMAVQVQIDKDANESPP